VNPLGRRTEKKFPSAKAKSPAEEVCVKKRWVVRKKKTEKSGGTPKKERVHRKMSLAKKKTNADQIQERGNWGTGVWGKKTIVIFGRMSWNEKKPPYRRGRGLGGDQKKRKTLAKKKGKRHKKNGSQGARSANEAL